MNRFTKVMGLGIFMFSALLALSNTTPGTDKNKQANSTEKTIRDYFRFPQVLIPLTTYNHKAVEKVEVLFTTGKNGQVDFALAKTGNRQLKTEIEKQFMTLKLAKLQSGAVHSIVLSFKAL